MKPDAPTDTCSDARIKAWEYALRLGAKGYTIRVTDTTKAWTVYGWRGVKFARKSYRYNTETTTS